MVPGHYFDCTECKITHTCTHAHLIVWHILWARSNVGFYLWCNVWYTCTCIHISYSNFLDFFSIISMIDKNVWGFDCLLAIGCKNILEVFNLFVGGGGCFVLFLRGCFAIEFYIFYKIGLNFIPNMQEVFFCLGFCNWIYCVEKNLWNKLTKKLVYGIYFSILYD